MPSSMKALYHVYHDDDDDDDAGKCMGTLCAPIEDAYIAGIHGDVYFKRYLAISSPTIAEQRQHLPQDLNMTPYVKDQDEIEDQEKHDVMVRQTQRFLLGMRNERTCAIIVVEEHGGEKYEAVLALSQDGYDAASSLAAPKIVHLWYQGDAVATVSSPPRTGQPSPLSPPSVLGTRGAEDISSSPVGETEPRNPLLVSRNRNAIPRTLGFESPSQPETRVLPQPVLRDRAQDSGFRNFQHLLGMTSDVLGPDSSPNSRPNLTPNPRPDRTPEILPDRSQRAFLGKVIESLENSEFDPNLALRWIKEKNEKPAVCQKNFVSEIDNFIDASYVMIANTQLGKTNSFLYLMFKAGVKAGMPSILLTQSNSTEPARFKGSIMKLNKLMEQHGKVVRKKYEPTFKGFKVPPLKMTAKTGEFNGFLESFSNTDGGDMRFIPVFVSLTNFTRVKRLVKSMDRRAGGNDTVCCMLRKHGFVNSEGRRRLKAMVVFDEADQNINASVDGDPDAIVIGTNKITRALFLENRSVGESGDGYGHIVKADNLFDMFSVTVDVTATPHSLVYGKRDLSNRAVRKIITGSPSKHGFQYEKRPEWESKLIDRMEVQTSNGLASMIDHMIANGDQVRNRHAAVISSDITRVAQQRIQAHHYAAKYASNELITATWSRRDGVCVFTKCNVEGSGSDASIDPEDDSSIPLKVVHTSFNLTSNKNAGEVVRMYRGNGGTAWETEKRFEERIRRTIQASAEATAATGGDARLPLTQDDIQRKVDEAKASSEMVTIAKYTDSKGTYPTFVDLFENAMKVVASDEGIPLSEMRVNTVVFGKDMMERGVTVKGATSHACGLTDMYVQVENHYTLLVQVCGRLCGNHYHECDDSCPAHGPQEVCPLERKILWATREVHDMHENAIKFIHFLVETAAEAGDDGMRSLEDLLARMEKTVVEAALYPVTEASLSLNPEMKKDFQAMQMMAWKATGGKFPFEGNLQAIRRKLAAIHGFTDVSGYQANVEINGRTMLTAPTVYVDAAPVDEPPAEPASVVDNREFDESMYFISNFKELLNKMNEPGYIDRPSMIPKFKGFLKDHVVEFLARGVFALPGQGSAGLQDYILLGVDSSGNPNVRSMRASGRHREIMKKYESVCRKEFSTFA